MPAADPPITPAAKTSLTAAKQSTSDAPAPRRGKRPLPPWVSTTLLWAERIAAVLATLAAVVVHVVAVRETGGIWRDEASSVDVINQANSYLETWKLNYYDSFPILWSTLLRTWIVLGPGQSDIALRSLGCLVGIGIIAMVWWNAWKLTGRVPLLSLPLFVMAPGLIRYGDGVRGYGLGILALLTLPIATWNLLREPKRRQSVLFILASLFAVQTSFSNCCLLLAIGIGAGFVCIRERSWKALGVIALGGVVSILSMLPYLHTMALHQRWNEMVRIAADEHLFFRKLLEAIQLGGNWALPLWQASLLVSVAGGLAFLAWSSPRISRESKSLVLFCVVSLVTAIVCLTVYFRFLKVETHPWYYIPLLGLVAVLVGAAIDAMIGDQPLARLLRLACVLFVAPTMIAPGLTLASTRFTNVDLVAAKLEGSAVAGDLILMNPWQAQNVFSRYYRGSAEWSTVPPTAHGRHQPYQEFKIRMAETDPLRPVFNQMEAALKSGHSVWYISEEHAWGPAGYSLLPFISPSAPIPPAPHPVFGWQHPPYDYQWRHECLHFLNGHAGSMKVLTEWRSVKVLSYEKVLVHHFSGWKQTP